ncbi:MULTISPECIES: hypothetical protein [Microbulbifer]|uniref:hypothetical protein n=1 Tax=Microbulbifer TaxID=48073 RepID=UPI001E46717F|nr:MULTISPECIES: hypothetical protein [Microbulbifer]UHQ54012.1 hypothetical protein LVE68_10845 [Microbulbifer sp. YPW16]
MTEDSSRKLLLAQMALLSALGLVVATVAALVWGLLPGINPLFQWMLADLAGTAWFYPLVGLQDLVINMLLWSPVALLIVRMPAGNTPLLLGAALVPALLGMSWPLWHLAGATGLGLREVLALLVQLAALPLVWLLLSRRRAGKPASSAPSAAV